MYASLYDATGRLRNQTRDILRQSFLHRWPSVVISDGGIVYVDTRKSEWYGGVRFRVYREGFSTQVYEGVTE